MSEVDNTILVISRQYDSEPLCFRIFVVLTYMSVTMALKRHRKTQTNAKLSFSVESANLMMPSAIFLQFKMSWTIEWFSTKFLGPYQNHNLILCTGSWDSSCPNYEKRVSDLFLKILQVNSSASTAYIY